MTDLWPSRTEPHGPPFVRELALRLAQDYDEVVLVPRLLLRRAHRRIWGENVQGWQRDFEQREEIRVVPYPLVRPPKGSEALPRALGARAALALRRSRPRLVHGHFLYAVGPAAVRLARSLGVPVLLTAHGTDVRWLRDRDEVPPRYLAEMIDACRRADKISVVAQWMVEPLRALGVAEDRIALAPMGVDEKLFRPRSRAEARGQLGVAPDERAVLFVGRATREKGADVLRGALSSLGERVRCYVAGPFPIDGATHLGTLAPEQLARWLSAVDLVCLPSFSEGMSVAVSEALGAGTPVIASAVGGLVEQVRPGENGLLVPPGDPAALAAALNDALARTWDQQAIRESSTPYWWNTLAPRYSALYAELLSRSGITRL